MAQEKKRGGWLTFWLAFLLFGNVFSFLSMVVYAAGLLELLSFPLWAVYLLGTLFILNIILLIFLFTPSAAQRQLPA